MKNAKLIHIVQIQHRQKEKRTKLHKGERNPHPNVMENIKTTHKCWTQNHRL